MARKIKHVNRQIVNRIGIFEGAVGAMVRSRTSGSILMSALGYRSFIFGQRVSLVT